MKTAEFIVQEHEPKEATTAGQVQANKANWGLAL